jgi:L-threonylcarbamoyladenylate synthase
MHPEVERAAALLRAGQLVGFPTETVYGLGANALDAEAVAKIFALKGRPATSPLIVHVASLEDARALVTTWPPLAEALAARHWPGPLTLVLPKQPRIPDAVTAGLATVGIRIPAHPLALELIRAAGVPIAAPSANRFTELSPTTADHVRRAFGDALPCVLDGGPTPVGIESTVLSLATPRPLLLRPGMVTRAEIEALAGPVDTLERAAGAHPSPGLHERHYTPRTRLVLGPPPPTGRGVRLSHDPAARAEIEMPAAPFDYAAVLYATLHRLDAEGWDWIALDPVPSGPAWDGIRDRLRRAATPPEPLP